ncbi:MAG: DUF4290 domain-containing protein [Rikenellaceae bacterium]
MRKNYNNTRQKLHLPEYGRHIQQMVDALCLIEDRAERNKQARAVIAVMGNVNPLLRDTPVFTHKLWDHLFMISDFQLDVDSPYAQPSRDDLLIKPRRLSYPQRRIVQKHYGKYVGQMIRVLSKESREDAESSVDNLVVYMRSKSFEYNQEHPNNDIIIKDIKKMSDGVIQINEDSINNIQSDYKQHLSAHSSKSQQRNNGRNGYKNRSAHGQHPTNNARNVGKNGAQRRNQPK